MKPGMFEERTPKAGQSCHAGTGLKLVNLKRKTGNGKLTEEAEIMKTIMDARDEWLESVANFEQVHDENLVDYYTYKMKASLVRYEYFIKKAKEMGLKNT